ncbi:pyridoxal phosphate-dependent aminotransferase [Chloroflexota bacterium]
MGIADGIRQGMEAGSWIRRMFEEGVALKKQHGAENVFDLSIGNPVMEPPEEFRQELKRLAENPVPGMHRYMENAGYADTRAAVADQLSGETGLKLTVGDIVMTCGAAGALNVALKTLLNPGEEVILFAPYFVEYANYIENHNGVVKVLPTGEGFLPDLEALEKAINPKTKALIINSPNNPTGVVYDDALLRRLGKLLREKESRFGTGIYLVSDEPYRKIIYDGLKYASPLPCHPRTIVVTSHSKDLALPGERIGYIAVNPACNRKDELINGLIYCNRTLGYVNAPALMQRIVARLQAVTVSVAEYQRKRDFLYGHLVDMGYQVMKPQGAFYLFPRSPVDDDVAFVRELQQWNVLAVPGSGFGTPGYFRVSYCVEDSTLEGALTGFGEAACRHGLGSRERSNDGK